jgi:LytS/YehU family sensor histidine kinase
MSLFLHWNLLTYSAIVAVIMAIGFYRQWVTRERQALQLEAELARAQLDALKTQLNPHFLFNSLNGIAELILEMPQVAEQMLLRLSDLLRSTLSATNTHELRLDQEIAFIRNYLEIERMRFQDRLSIDWEIDPALMSVMVPSLILQPLVENSLRHGIAPRAGPGSTARAGPASSARPPGR